MIVLPQGVAFATIAGMPPEYGLYAAMVPAIIAAERKDNLHIMDLNPEERAALPPIATISAMRKLTS